MKNNPTENGEEKKKAEKQKNRTVLKLEYRLYRKVSSPNICITFKNPPA